MKSKSDNCGILMMSVDKVNNTNNNNTNNNTTNKD